MCENAVKGGVVTGPPTKEKKEIEPFWWDSSTRGRVCVAGERLGTKKIQPRNLPSPAGFVTQVEEFRDLGISDVTVTHFCNCSIADLSIPDLCLRCRKNGSISRSSAHSFRSAD